MVPHALSETLGTVVWEVVGQLEFSHGFSKHVVIGIAILGLGIWRQTAAKALPDKGDLRMRVTGAQAWPARYEHAGTVALERVIAAIGANRASARFVAITDPRSKLQEVADLA